MLLSQTYLATGGMENCTLFRGLLHLYRSLQMVWSELLLMYVNGTADDLHNIS